MPALQRLSVALAALLLGSMATVTLARAQGGPPAMPVGVSEPIAKRVIQWDEYSGRFEALAIVEIRARVSGFVEKLHFKDGQTVKAGDPLFTIDKRPYEIAVESAISRLAMANIGTGCAVPQMVRRCATS